MINELYKLSEALDRAGISAQRWHRKYIPIGTSAPCVRIEISDGKVTEVSEVSAELKAELRKYGSNQGSFPCMNLAPLYRVTDKTFKEEVEKLTPEKIDSAKIEELKSRCTVNNWDNSKFRNKYNNSINKTPGEMMKLLPEYEPLRILSAESIRFSDPDVLHKELEDAVFAMLEKRENVSLAIYVLFNFANPEKKDDYGSISAALDASALIDMGMPAVSGKFVRSLNNALLNSDVKDVPVSGEPLKDAFGNDFVPISEPMPEIKLAGGFSAKLRTMYHDKECQKRYGRIEDAGYPISDEIRKKLAAALGWLGCAERRDKTWIVTEKDEILFAYPSELRGDDISYTGMFHRPADNSISFVKKSGSYIEALKKTKRPGSDSKADNITIFILRKVDNACTKVVYTRQTDPYELEKRSEEWTAGCRNLPNFPFGKPFVLFPLEVSDIENRFFKQSGELSTNKFRPIPKYHGMELFLERDLHVTADIHSIAEKEMTVGAHSGMLLANGDTEDKIWYKIKEMLALTGLLLYRRGIRKDEYMNELPYLYGQLLKTSDELHALYCTVVREGKLPAQLAGSGLYASAAEAPVRTIDILAQRMNPYITWAKTYRTKGLEKSGLAGWLLAMYEDIATKLSTAWTSKVRFSDEEKAQLFIGYLAAFPKKDKSGDGKDEDKNIKENEDNE